MVKFSKGYKNDAGVDVIMDREIIFRPHSVTTINLGVKLTPKRNTMLIIAPRSSYARQGLILCNCPVDADYDGEIHAIVYNSSNEEIICKENTSFCQIMNVKIKTIKNVEIRKKGKRKSNCFGSTGG